MKLSFLFQNAGKINGCKNDHMKFIWWQLTASPQVVFRINTHTSLKVSLDAQKELLSHSRSISRSSPPTLALLPPSPPHLLLWYLKCYFYHMLKCMPRTLWKWLSSSLCRMQNNIWSQAHRITTTEHPNCMSNTIRHNLMIHSWRGLSRV